MIERDNMSNFKKFILILIIIILILIVLILSLANKAKKIEIQQNFIKEFGENDGRDISELYGIVSNVVDNNEYYTIKSIVEKYIYLISSEDKIAALNLISPVCKDELDINQNNINMKTGIPLIENGYEYYILNISDMHSIIEEKNVVYIVKGNYKSSENDNSYNINLMIALDNNNKTFDIYTEEYMKNHNYNNINIKDKINFESKTIDNRVSNIYEIKNVNKLDMANNYFNDFKNKLLTQTPEEIYESIIDVEYAKKRFETVEEFKQYLIDRRKTFANMEINEYQVDTGDNYVDYICTDQYENYYIFRVNGAVMEYNVLLDAHTLENKDFTNKYNIANDKEKVMMNIHKFIRMVNAGDYKAAYGLLDSSFINNNFNTLDKFKEYVKNNFFEYNDITYNSIKLESNVYICSAILSDKKTDIQKEIEVIIKLETEQNFCMSFNIQ